MQPENSAGGAEFSWVEEIMSRSSSHRGRRGRKHLKQERRIAQKDELLRRERRLERERRAPLIAKIVPWMTELCRRSSCNIATDSPDDYMRGTFFCPEGRVLSCVVDVDTVDIRKVVPWMELSSDYLDSVMKRQWKSFRAKNVLELISERVSLLVG